LDEIKECINKDKEMSKLGIEADFESLKAVKEKITELSSSYYELVPLS
jgi:hypothetical protein